jgi:hypothetical protein
MNQDPHTPAAKPPCALAKAFYGRSSCIWPAHKRTSSVASPSGVLESCHRKLHEDIAHRLDGLALRARLHVGIGVKRLAVAHAGARLDRGEENFGEVLFYDVG